MRPEGSRDEFFGVVADVGPGVGLGWRRCWAGWGVADNAVGPEVGDVELEGVVTGVEELVGAGVTRVAAIQSLRACR